MSQKISSFYYIKNNKRRVSVLVVSLAMFFVVIYITMFLLSTTSKTFESILTKTTKYVQCITLYGDDVDMDYDSDSDEDYSPMYMEAVREKYDEIAETLKKYDGIEEVFVAQVEYSYITSIVGNAYVNIPMVNREQMDKMLEHMGADLLEGHLPTNPNEAVLDSKMIKNYGYRIGDGLSQNNDVKIVGIIECDFYFGCGLVDEDSVYSNPKIYVLTDGTVNDLKKAAETQGIELKDSEFFDVKEGKKEFKNELVDVIASSTKLIFTVIIIIVSILVIIVNISYMRDRRSEWCLYASIGYGRRTIYYSILREMLFVFVFAFFAAVVICIILMKILDVLMITELGLLCSYFMPELLVEILCAYVMIFGLLQIPIRVAMYKIKTIDAIDDDM